MTERLLPFQEKVVEEIARFGGRSLLAMDMGTGKTFTVLEWVRRTGPAALPCVVVCQVSVKWFWEREARLKCGMESEILEGRSPKGRFAENGRGLTVVNYDVLCHWLDWLRHLQPKTIILDECQFVMSAKAKRTKAAKTLCRGVPHVLALSGTPLVNRPIELFTTLSILRPVEYRSQFRFAQRYCNPWRSPWGWKYRGASNVEELHKKLKRAGMIRRRKADVLPELPEKIREVLPVDLPDRREYDRARDDFLGWLETVDPTKARRAARAVALTRFSHLRQTAARLKVGIVSEWIVDFIEASDEKLIVFCVHRGMVRALAERSPVGTVVIDGSVTGRRRQEAVDHFQDDPSVRLLVGNIHAAGVGLTLTAAQTVLFAEMAWRPGDHTQAEDRPHRIGQTGSVRIVYMVARDTIEEHLCEIIQAKQGVLSAVLDGGRVEGDLDVFDLLMRKMREGLGAVV